MTIKTIDVHDEQNQLADLLDQAAAGTEIILTEDNQPRARLVPILPSTFRRVPNLHPGSMIMAPDFDAPLPDEFWLGTE